MVERDMKRNLTVFILVPLMACCTSCVSLITSRGQSWETIQSMGGLRVNDPVMRDDGTFFLPVVCNVSGLDTITVKPTAINSALVVRKIATRIKKHTIQIQIVTCVVDNRHTSCTKGVEIGSLQRGTYQVEYLNPDGMTVPIRTVEMR